MAAISTIVINDGKATPVAHTFNPVQSAPDAVYREGLSSLPLIGQGVIDLRTRTQGELNRVKVTLKLPVLETATGANAQGYTAAPKVAYHSTANVEFILPSRGTAEQRKDLRVMLANLLLNAQLVDNVDNLNIPF